MAETLESLWEALDPEIFDPDWGSSSTPAAIQQRSS